MSKLTFYHQVRVDGGERTGIDADDTELLHFFQPGASEEEHDPRLLWYVDVRCEGDRLPGDASGARDWFLQNQPFFVQELTRIAEEELDVGFDAENRPYQREVGGAPDGARVLIVVSAVRRLVGREVADHVRQMANQWSQLLNQLVPLSMV